MTTPLTDEQREFDEQTPRERFENVLRWHFNVVAEDGKGSAYISVGIANALIAVDAMLAAERERADRAEREAADLLAIDPDWPDRPRAVATRWQVRADREKARADALEDVIARVRKRLNHGLRFWPNDEFAVHVAFLLRAELAALLPDDTEEADRG